MKKEDIFNYMKQPEAMDRSTVEELQHLVYGIYNLSFRCFRFVYVSIFCD